MEIKFLGTGAAEGFPSVFCNCDYCNFARTIGASEYRMRSQILIDGCLSIDLPPEAYSNSLKYGFNLGDIKYILATHSHMDHFYAHDLILRGYKYAQVNEPMLQIFGNSEVKAVFTECTSRELKPQVASGIEFHELNSYQKILVGEYIVLTLPAQHSKNEDCLLFYIERNGKGYLHLYDTARIEDKAFKFLAENHAKAQVVAIDCTFVENTASPQSRHMGIEDVMMMKHKLLSCGVIDSRTKIVITHFSHNGNPIRAHLAELEKKYNVIAAYDGMKIEF